MLIAKTLLAANLVLLAGGLEWPQWGGPDRNFVVRTSDLADEWPAGGPKTLWSRQLGDGYSAIVAADGVLYTMYRKQRTDRDEYTVALDARTGKTLWEHGGSAPLAAPPAEPPDSRWGGQGPNATPLIVGSRLFTIGSNAVMHCYERKSGKVLWRRDLGGELGATYTARHANTGHSSSPIAYEKTVIVPLGRARSSSSKGQSLVALSQADGTVVWTSQDFENGFSSPILITFADRTQLVLHVREALLGVDPADGHLLWRHPAPGGGGPVITPVWNNRDRLLIKDGGDGGSAYMIQLGNQDGKTVPEELWSSRHFILFTPTPVFVDGILYGSTRQLLVALDAETGERAWAEREYPSATVVHADGKLIILDENGRLTLATPGSQGLTVHSQRQVTEKYSLTAPTLVGTTLFIRDLKQIMALDLG